LVGNGNGTFKVLSPGKRVALDVLSDGGQTQVLLANQQANHVVIETPVAGGQQFAPTPTGAAAPQGTPFAPAVAVSFALDKNPSGPNAVVVPAAVVVGSTSNSLQVNRLDPSTRNYVPTAYSVGTNPVAVTIQDLNGDDIPDMLVANEGSNDISV